MLKADKNLFRAQSTNAKKKEVLCYPLGLVPWALA